jgi:predicted murein hydrolase (TIGR00659 family)
MQKGYSLMLSPFNLYIPIGLLLTITVYSLSLWVYEKKPSLLTNPMILSIIVIGFILWGSDTSYDKYYEGGGLIAWFLGPATIALAIPVKKTFPVLVKYKGAIIFGCLVGTVTAVMSSFWISYLAGFPSSMIYSLIPKHVTTPIAIELSRIMGGNTAITVGVVFFTGIFGYLTVGFIMDRFRLQDPVLRGLLSGVSFHGLGAIHAMEENELTGAIGSIAFIMTGTITSFLIPIAFLWFRTVV